MINATIINNATPTIPPIYGMTLTNAPIIPSRTGVFNSKDKRADYIQCCYYCSFDNQSYKITLNNIFGLSYNLAHLNLVACAKEPVNKLN